MNQSLILTVHMTEEVLSIASSMYMEINRTNIYNNTAQVGGIIIIYTVEPPNKGHFGNGPLVLCSEVVPISEVHDFSTHFDCIILNKLVNALKCIIREVEMIIKWLVCSVFSINIAQAEFFCF